MFFFDPMSVMLEMPIMPPQQFSPEELRAAVETIKRCAEGVDTESEEVLLKWTDDPLRNFTEADNAAL